jgi:hypothetical protein
MAQNPRQFYVMAEPFDGIIAKCAEALTRSLWKGMAGGEVVCTLLPRRQGNDLRFFSES